MAQSNAPKRAPFTPTNSRPPRPSTPPTTNPNAISDNTSPRKHKRPSSTRLEGVQTGLASHFSVGSIKSRLRAALKLDYEPDDWQAHAIQRVLRGYDTVLCAGTGYGKSLIFEGLAHLSKKKVIIVICPLKALEKDQADQAREKGLRAHAINEDTVKTKDLWMQLRKSASLVYLSPEMVQAASFRKLWADRVFCKRVAALIVDEAHCTDEWGDDAFRPMYRKLFQLRAYTGMEIPFVACTATCSTPTFDIIWNTLGYGSRPFWGLDVGVDRPNLFFGIREMADSKMPVLDFLACLPRVITADMSVEEILSKILKTLIYVDSEAACRQFAYAIRMCLPAALRGKVGSFSSDLSEAAKAELWAKFVRGEILILVCTDAAGMGCNVPDVRCVMIYGLPKSFASVAQRWGRAGRNRTVEATCLLFVPSWSINPARPALVSRAIEKSAAKESKVDVERREKMEPTLREFVNLGSSTNSCQHAFLRKIFRPEAALDLLRGYDENNGISKHGSRAAQLAFQSTWTHVDLQRKPPPSRCCAGCNPELMKNWRAASADDPRLYMYASEFKFPLARPPISSPRPSSSASNTSSSSSRSTFEPVSRSYKASSEDKAVVRKHLLDWRKKTWTANGSSDLWPEDAYLPEEQLNTLTRECAKFLQHREITLSVVRSVTRLDLLTDPEVEGIAATLTAWRENWNVRRTPRAARVRPRTDATASPMRSLSLVHDTVSSQPSMAHDDNFMEGPEPSIFTAPPMSMGGSSTSSRPTTPVQTATSGVPLSPHYRSHTVYISAHPAQSSIGAPAPAASSYYRPKTNYSAASTPAPPPKARAKPRSAAAPGQSLIQATPSPVLRRAAQPYPTPSSIAPRPVRRSRLQLDTTLPK